MAEDHDQEYDRQFRSRREFWERERENRDEDRFIRQKEFDKLRDRLNDLVIDFTKLQSGFETVKMIVFGMVSIILVAFVVAIARMIMNGAGPGPA